MNNYTKEVYKVQEIRLRAWDKKRKEMFPVHELHFNRISYELDWIRGYGDSDADGTDVYGGGIMKYANDDRYVLMQYTGLKDKDGKDACESDVLQTPVGKAVIRFGLYSNAGGIEEYHYGFYVEFEDKDNNYFYRKELGYRLLQSRIVGNVYEYEGVKEDD